MSEENLNEELCEEHDIDLDGEPCPECEHEARRDEEAERKFDMAREEGRL